MILKILFILILLMKITANKIEHIAEDNRGDQNCENDEHFLVDRDRHEVPVTSINIPITYSYHCYDRPVETNCVTVLPTAQLLFFMLGVEIYLPNF
jgi:hypothetical protein